MKTLNWYKSKIIKTSLSRVHRPNPENVKRKRLQLFNYLKTFNVKHVFYHGTSKKVYEKIAEKLIELNRKD